MVRYGTVQHNTNYTMQYNTIRYSTVQYSTVQYGTQYTVHSTQYNTIHYNSMYSRRQIRRNTAETEMPTTTHNWLGKTT